VNITPLAADSLGDVAVMTCAVFVGKAVDQFEANRDALYGVPGANRDASGR